MTTGGPGRSGEQVPSGWYPDPDDADRLRTWDGRGWTDSWMKADGGGVSAAAPSSARFRSTAALWATDPWDRTRSRLWDGRAWTDRVRSGPTFHGRGSLGGGFFGLASALQVLLLLCAATAGGAAVASWWTAVVLGRWTEDPDTATLAEGSRVDLVTALSEIAVGAAIVVTGVVFVVWLFRAHGSDRVDPMALGLAKGWTIAGWVVPVVSLWFPRRSVAEVWRGARLGRLSRETPLPGQWRLEAWWVSWVLALLLGRAASLSGPRDDVEGLDYIEGLRNTALTNAGANAVLVVAAVLAFLVVRAVTEDLRRPESVDAPRRPDAPSDGAAVAGELAPGEVSPGGP